MGWRKQIRSLHRDIGYVAAALTVAYAISGLAVNHIEDWNPNYRFEERAVELGPMSELSLDEREARVVEALALDPATVRGRIMDTETRLRVFLTDGGEVSADVRTGAGRFKQVETRAVLYEANALHLNNLKGIWTWVADLFALALLFLALSGLLLHKGRLGLAGRGKWFAGAGLGIPAVFVAYLYYGA
ncbi:PepSY-associated TM helix domain-containing protein [Haliangium sp.]|uniref:PepSY-associated TM helix domain-containing protein n=1 Tax=Haliangium sp. TaxID=2663208 RepID=UPI003D12E665